MMKAGPMARLVLAVPGAFAADECDRIVVLGEAGRAEPGPVHGDGSYSVDRGRRERGVDPARA